MSKHRRFLFPASLVLFAALVSGCQGPALPLVSSEAVMDKEGQTILQEDFLYPDTDEPQVTSSIVTLQEGAETGLHLHEAPMYAYVMEGTLQDTYLVEGVETIKVYEEGEAIMEGLDTPHNGKNIGEGPVRVLVVNMGSPDLENTVMLD